MKKISFGERIAPSVYNTGVVMRALLSQTFSELKFELTQDQFIILDLIIENGELYQRQIAEITLKDRANVARIIKILEDKDLITKEEGVNKRRIYKIRVTKKGKEIRDKIKPKADSLRKIIAKDITKEELDITLNTLNKVYDNVRPYIKLQI